MRNANISIAVAAAFLVSSVLLFGDASEAVVQTIGLAGLFLAFLVMALLEARETRRHKDQ